MVKDIFRINDWKISEFFIAIFSVQFALLGLALPGMPGFDIPLARPVVGFIYLTFVPGALLLRIFRIHRTSGTETALYAAGLSLAFDMLTGFLINILCPILGVDGPITESYVILAMLFGVLLLSGLCYFRDRDYSDDGTLLELDVQTLAPVLFLLLVPLVGALSSYLVNAYDVNALIYITLCLVALIMVLCGFRRFIPERLYPLAICSAALALLFHNAFVTDYLWSWDVHHEYNIASLVIDTGYWDTSVIGYLNSMLSVVILAPFYHFVCGIDLTWVFKIAYQFLFALVPVGLFTVFRRQAGSRIACLSCLLFISLVTFYTEMQGLTRQEVAELFLVLIVMLMTDATQNVRTKSFLMIVFGMALIVSHYGLAYIYILVFALSLALLQLTMLAKKLLDRAPRGLLPASSGSLIFDHSLTLPFVGAFTCFLFFWYIYTSESSALRSVSYILFNIGTSVFDEFLNPDNVQGLSKIMQGSISPLYDVKKYMHLTFQGFIVIGLVAIVLQCVINITRKRAYRFSVEYAILSLINVLICIFAITVPFFASALNTSRIYQITLVILAPLCIIGGLELIKAALYPLKLLKADVGEHAIKIMTLIVVLYLFFNSGLIFNLANDHPMSVSLSKSQINSYSLNDRASLYDALNTHEQDCCGAGWLKEHRMPGRLVYSDYIARYPISSYGNTTIAFQRYYDVNLSNIGRGAYVFLGYANLKGDVIIEKSGNESIFSVQRVLPGLESRDKIYASDGCVIYRAQ